MNKKGTSTFNNGLIWFGAGVSIAEILTGTYFAPLGFKKGILAIVLGHLIGCVLLFLVGLIGGYTRKSAMETVKISFGQKGCLLFAILNVLQLVGWTTIMIYDGAIAINGIFHTGAWIWSLIIGTLIIIWLLIGIANLEKVNRVAMIALFILTLVLCKVIFFNGNSISITSDDSLSFGSAVELAVAMPLSWLPLISDYTREAEEPIKATIASAITYGIISCWMYVIGMGAAIFTGEYDIVQIMMKAGLGMIGLLIIIFSTVTTTFMDAYSAGVSSETIFSKLNGKRVAIIITIMGTIGAIIYPMDNIIDFLYLVGSVFAPMAAIQISDYFILKRDNSKEKIDWKNIFVWLLGFITYQKFVQMDTQIGNTLPSMLFTIVLSIVVNSFVRLKNRKIFSIQR
jgi:putative hydroxymethylpyrimidine transporter CytX